MLASAGTNEIRHHEFNKSWLDPQRVNTEKRLGSSPLAYEDETRYTL
jgi:hypothetical protein